MMCYFGKISTWRSIKFKDQSMVFVFMLRASYLGIKSKPTTPSIHNLTHSFKYILSSPLGLLVLNMVWYCSYLNQWAFSLPSSFNFVDGIAFCSAAGDGGKLTGFACLCTAEFGTEPWAPHHFVLPRKIFMLTCFWFVFRFQANDDGFLNFPRWWLNYSYKPRPSFHKVSRCHADHEK